MKLVRLILLSLVVIAAAAGRAAEPEGASATLSRYVTIEDFGSVPGNVYGLLALTVADRNFSGTDKDRLLAMFAGQPPTSPTTDEFEAHREAARRLEIVKNRVAEWGRHVSLPGIMLEYSCDLGRYDFSLKGFPLTALPDRTNTGWCFGIALPKPKEISSASAREMKAAFFLAPALAQQACNGADAQWYNVVPCRNGQSQFPEYVPVDQATAERLVSVAKAKRSAPRVTVRLYGHFDESRLIFQREGGDFWRYRIRFNLERVELLNGADPREVLYSGR